MVYLNAGIMPYKYPVFCAQGAVLLHNCYVVSGFSIYNSRFSLPCSVIVNVYSNTTFVRVHCDWRFGCMKKIVFWALIIALVLCMAVNRIEGMAVNRIERRQIVYPSGRDTLESFGDGTYQLIRVAGCEGLGSAKYHTGIIDQVNQIKQTTDKVYVIGSEVWEIEVDGETVECCYTIYVVISLCDNTMQICIVPEYPFAPDVHIHRMKKMIENNDAQRLDKFTDFSDADQMEFNELLRTDNGG